MGTNYYVTADEELHIGKQSAGWAFCFAPYPDRGLTSRRAWLEFLRKHPDQIRDEYGDVVSVADLEALSLRTKDGLDAARYYEKYPEHRRPDNLFDATAYETKDADGFRFSTTADFS